MLPSSLPKRYFWDWLFKKKPWNWIYMNRFQRKETWTLYKAPAVGEVDSDSFRGTGAHYFKVAKFQELELCLKCFWGRTGLKGVAVQHQGQCWVTVGTGSGLSPTWLSPSKQRCRMRQWACRVGGSGQSAGVTYRLSWGHTTVAVWRDTFYPALTH